MPGCDPGERGSIPLGHPNLERVMNTFDVSNYKNIVINKHNDLSLEAWYRVYLYADLVLLPRGNSNYFVAKDRYGATGRIINVDIKDIFVECI